jgi:hypothetical protein
MSTAPRTRGKAVILAVAAVTTAVALAVGAGIVLGRGGGTGSGVIARTETTTDTPVAGDQWSQNDGKSPSTGKSLAASYGIPGTTMPMLTKMGVACKSEPVEVNALTEEWPSADQVQHDYAPVQRLTGIQREVYECLRMCLPSDPDDWEGLYLASARKCFDARAVEVVKAAGLIDVWSVVRSLLAGWPNLNYFCHSTGHAAGSAAITDTDITIRDAVLSIGADCLGGAMHGVLDAFGETKPGLPEFEQMIRTCEAHTDPVNVLFYCSDGTGHAAWDAYEDYAKTTEICGMWSDLEMRLACDEGVLMRQYERKLRPPDGDGFYIGGDLDEYRTWAAYTVKICDTWEKVSTRSVDEEPADGCHRGIQYVLGMAQTYLVRSEGLGDWRQIKDIQQWLGAFADACASFDERGEALCRATDGKSFASLAAYDLVGATELCNMLKDRRDICIEDATLHIKSRVTTQ